MSSILLFPVVAAVVLWLLLKVAAKALVAIKALLGFAVCAVLCVGGCAAILVALRFAAKVL